MCFSFAMDIKEFEQFLKAFIPSKDDEAIKKDLRYVIYARKSREGVEQQVRSVPDQLETCRELKRKEGLLVVDEILEAESAKTSDSRPQFKEMMAGIKAGKYDAILSWHPDRLARNMKDAGEIIDLLDRGIIKNLKFVSFNFENSTIGKVMLGIAFVFAKQYSDALGANVLRGIDSSANEGKFLGKSKHGYFKDEEQKLRPNGRNFELIKLAFQKRLQGATETEIADFLNEHHYEQWTPKNGNQIYKMINKRVGEFLKDPVYTGMLRYGDRIINLVEAIQFVPAVSPMDFIKINEMEKLQKRFRLRNRHLKQGGLHADFLHRLVICGYCNQTMTPGITTKPQQGHKYFFFKCDTKKCEFHNKSVRAKEIVGFVVQYLQEHEYTSRKVYGHYQAEMQRLHRASQADLESEMNSIRQTLKHLKGKIQRRIDDRKELKDYKIVQYFEEDLKGLLKEQEKLEADLVELKTKKEEQSLMILDYDKFVELFKDFALRLRNERVMEKKDFLIKKIFSNFVIKDKKVASFSLNQPFLDLDKYAEVRNGRGYRIRTCDLLVPNQTR